MGSPRISHRLLSFLATIVLVGFFLGQMMASADWALAAPEGEAGIAVASFGDGRVALVWPAVASLYQGGGWQLFDSQTNTPMARWSTEDLARGLAFFSQERQQRLRPFIGQLAAENDPEKRLEMVSFLMMGAMADFQAALRLGMGFLLEGVPPGAHSYHIVFFDGEGRPVGSKLYSPAIDGWLPSPLPAEVVNLRAKSNRHVVELYWDQCCKELSTSLVQIIRIDEHGAEIDLTPDMVWVSAGREAEQPAFIDDSAPLEKQLHYQVRQQDLFGRLSPPAGVSHYHADLEALLPPQGLSAVAAADRIELQWRQAANPLTTGYVLERARRNTDIYEVLTPEGLPTRTAKFVDTGVEAGFTYYYRLRAVGPRGDVGRPGDSVAAMAEAGAAPKAPGKLQGEVKPTRVRLSWERQPLPVAGYIIEKKVEDDGVWVRLNSSLVTLAEFDDPLNLGDYGLRKYRVSAVAFGNQRSKPSAELSVQLPNLAPVPKPFLQEADSTDGLINLRFRASLPPERTASFFLVRGNSPEDLGLIIAQDIKGSATTFEDKQVRPGQDYWYALVALDKDGQRSEMSNKLTVFVDPPPLPQADPPKVRFIDTPFRRVAIGFSRPTGYMRVAVMRRAGDGPWVTIARDVADSEEVIDADPPETGFVEYRIAYTDESQGWGQPSKAVQLNF